jgi:energy-coupling factor transport system ATP-binding protein
MKGIVETQNLNYTYNTDTEEEVSNVLIDINFKVKKGEFIAVLGHNGSGKSTLAKHFNALLLPSGGKVYVKNMDTSDVEKWWFVRQNVGMVFQNPDNQIVSAIVEEDVAFGPENMAINSEEIRERVKEALNIVNMYEYRKHAPHLLSGGQKQRVAIAGVLAMKPEIIVLDEPTAMLDPVGRKEVLEAIIKLNRQEKITVILITHYMDEAVNADRVVVMDEGRIIMNDIPKKIFSQVDKLKMVGLDVPQVTELVKQLKDSGINIKNDIIDVEECVDEIISLMGKRNDNKNRKS